LKSQCRETSSFSGYKQVFGEAREITSSLSSLVIAGHREPFQLAIPKHACKSHGSIMVPTFLLKPTAELQILLDTSLSSRGSGRGSRGPGSQCTQIQNTTGSEKLHRQRNKCADSKEVAWTRENYFPN